MFCSQGQFLLKRMTYLLRDRTCIHQPVYAFYSVFHTDHFNGGQCSVSFHDKSPNWTTGTLQSVKPTLVLFLIFCYNVDG